MKNTKDLPKRERPVKTIKNKSKDKYIRFVRFLLLFVSILFIGIGIALLKGTNTENESANQESINETLYVDAGNEDANKNHKETPNKNQNQPTEDVKEDVSEKNPEKTTEHTNLDSYTDIEEKPSVENISEATPPPQTLMGALSFGQIVYDQLPEPCNKFYYFVVEKGDNISFVFESKFQPIDSEKMYWDIEFFSVDSSLYITDDYHFQTESEGNVIEVELNTLNFTPGIYMLKIGSAERHTSDEYSFQLINNRDVTMKEAFAQNTPGFDDTIDSLSMEQKYYDSLIEGYQNFYYYILEEKTDLIFEFECPPQGIGVKETYWDIEISSDIYYDQTYLAGDVAGYKRTFFQLEPGIYCLKISSAEKYTDYVYSFKMSTVKE